MGVRKGAKIANTRYNRRTTKRIRKEVERIFTD
jgi:hypothetical protein